MARDNSRQQSGRSRVAKDPASLHLWVAVFFTLVVAFVIVLTQWTRSGPSLGGRLPNLPTCSNLHPDRRDTPAVGLALSLTHATAAIAWPGGSSETVAAVRADDAYVEVMKRLSKASSRHVRPPYYGQLFSPGPSEWARQALRSARRVVGLPATSDVGTLAEPLKLLIDLVNIRLGCTPSDMVLVTVGVQALYDEDVTDIMRYLHLNQLPLRHYPRFRMGCEQPHELSSAFAAHGLGLCPTYRNDTACRAEESLMPFELVLSVSYTKKGIALSRAGFQSAYVGMGYDEIMSDLIGFDGLGSESKAGFPNDEAYWCFVRTTLGARIIQNTRWNYTRLFILDDVAADDADQLQRIMEDVLDQWQPGVVKVYKDEPLFTAATGAARFAQHGKYVKSSALEYDVSGSELRKRFPDPLACPWYGSTFD